MRSNRLALLAVVSAAAFSGCTVHPPGETRERQAALREGKPFAARDSERPSLRLPDNPTPDELVRYALQSSPELEQRYWEWRSAIEQIPQDGTQATNLAISGSTGISRGRFSTDRTVLTAGNDPMADIVWPEKLSTAARRALENAKAAGMRFQNAKYDLRHRVLSAYYDFALDAELIRLEQSNAELLSATAIVVEARNRAGVAGQQDLLKARNALDLSRNDIAQMQSQLLVQRANLDALLNREPHAVLLVPDQLPASRTVSLSDEQLVRLAAQRNPELQALADEIRGRAEGVELAHLEYIPDFSISASTDLAGITQTLAGAVTVPLLRYQAIDAAIAQATANLHSAEAMLRQSRLDLKARVVMDVAGLREADRQLALFEQLILPRAKQAVTVARSAYETGQETLLELLDSQRSLIDIQRLTANLRVMRAKRLADLEAVVAGNLESLGTSHG